MCMIGKAVKSHINATKTGWRVWKYMYQDTCMRLEAIAYSWVFESKTSKTRPPKKEGQTGFHVFKRKQLLKGFWCGTDILGKVKISGKVIEHEKGYIAEKIEILELYVPKNLEKGEIENLKKVYNCKVILGNSIEKKSK